MKKLCALAASLIIGAVSFGAQAGDRHHGHDRDDDRHYSHHHDGRHDHDRRGYVAYREYRPVYYRPAPVVYYRPVRYYSEPVYRERVRYRDYRDNDIHGSITVGF